MKVSSVHACGQLDTRLGLDWAPRVDTEISQSSWLLLFLSYCQNSADNRAAEAKSQFQVMQTKPSSHITQAVPAAPSVLHLSFLNTLNSAIHTSGVITPQVETFILLSNPLAKYPFIFYYQCLLFGLSYILCMTGSLPAASETSSDELGTAADALPSAPPLTLQCRTQSCSQTSVLSSPLHFWSYGGGKLPLVASGMVIKCHFPLTYL